MAYGWRQVFIGNREKHELAREKMWARIHLIPVLQAEEDRDQVRRYYADLGREQTLLGSQSGAYNSDRYVSTHRMSRGGLYSASKRRISHIRRQRNGFTDQVFFPRFVRPTFTATPERTTR
jgi:hypothetical protein